MGAWDTFEDMKNRVMDDLADHTDTFFDSNEVGNAVNEGIFEIYKILHAENRGYFFNRNPETITLTNQTNYYDLQREFAWVDEIRPTDDDKRTTRFYYKSRHDQEFRDLENMSLSEIFSNSDCFYYDVVGDKTLVIAPRASTPINVEVFTVQDPIEMINAGDLVPLKLMWRPLAVQYAARKLKNKDETGEYMSNEKLLGFLLENLSKYAGPRGGTNQLVVEDYSP